MRPYIIGGMWGLGGVGDWEGVSEGGGDKITELDALKACVTRIFLHGFRDPG